MSIFDAAIHIAPERSLFLGESRATERVLLPLTARFSVRYYISAVVVAFAALACVSMAAVLWLGARHGPADLAMAPVFAATAILPVAVALTAIVDFAAGAPVLTIDREGILDRRMREGKIAWERIASVDVVMATNGIAAVRLLLIEDSVPRCNPFRMGGWSADWRRRRRMRLVALLLLDKRPYTLAQTILTLARRR